MAPTSYQPIARSMDLAPADPEKASPSSRCQHQIHGDSRSRLAWIIAIASLMVFTLFAFFSDLECGPDGVGFGAGGGVFKRATEPTTDITRSGRTQSSFVRRKLYLIVVFVGLFVCLVLAVMLSAWCCKGAFQNPLCCPCYVCACCGGLACLECISCGLCAEGLEGGGGGTY
ncbi:hypothetical protein BOTBODRAFT_38945 [Botryobasidium botryosum FD-172 SS1]|uniref:Transmembrane protein n=1 Tax=Botryobasidium botryosum (strain FD-172 SS1) TaxID=930990 RepID=A0A067M6M5_BOTB1|nr:hypothetical protein BOTBODRAFT_38945 [Botryobasidium botryosum FD-172 SS1]